MNLSNWQPPHADLDGSVALYYVLSQSSGLAGTLVGRESSNADLIAFLRDWFEARRQMMVDRASRVLSENWALVYVVVKRSRTTLMPDLQRVGTVLAPSSIDQLTNANDVLIVSEFGRSTADNAPGDPSDVSLRKLLEFAIEDLSRRQI
jgi:hypothetical protein